MEYNKIDRQYAIWEDFVLTDRYRILIGYRERVYKNPGAGAKVRTPSALDDIILTEDLVQNSLYLVADPKSPARRLRAGCTAYRHAKSGRCGRIKTQVKRVGQGARHQRSSSGARRPSRSLLQKLHLRSRHEWRVSRAAFCAVRNTRIRISMAKSRRQNTHTSAIRADMSGRQTTQAAK